MCIDKKINNACLFLLFQGSEIFTVFARDGDQGNPNPIFYSILDGEQNYSLFITLHTPVSCSDDLSPFRERRCV